MVSLTIDPSRELLTARGHLLDRCAEALSLPRREIADDTGHVAIMESDRSYRQRLAAHFRRMAEALETS